MEHRPHTPLHRRLHARVVRVGAVCDAWCQFHRLYDFFTAASLGVGALILLYVFVVGAPASSPYGALVKVPHGTSIEQTGVLLKSKNIIRSAYLFDFLAESFSGGKGVVAGEYSFQAPQNVFAVVVRLIRGDYETQVAKVTIPEGATVKEIAAILTNRLGDFDSDGFTKIAGGQEGYLFPDTYFFLPGTEPVDAYTLLHNNFLQHIETPGIQADLSKSGHSLSDIVIMASLIEKEARTPQDKATISGILWHRIAIGMALQVDAVFPYIIGINSLQLTAADLKTNSPYNTYTNKGLPPGAIDNPGIDSLVAAMLPQKSNYLYYLSDLNGTMHYCATYACQLMNQKRYLGN